MTATIYTLNHHKLWEFSREITNVDEPIFRELQSIIALGIIKVEYF